MTVDPAPPAPLLPPGGTPNPQDDDAEHHHAGGYRDTIESILIAFILAFIFRAFVVEAFVIPTGSMAPTLLGAHARFTCTDCGYAFDANYSSPGSDPGIPDEVAHTLFPTRSVDEFRRREPRPVDCPNCGHTVHDPDDPRDNDAVPIRYGDRILVLKYAYLFQDPQRWDVVVFKSPDEPTPGSTWYTTNFIKRLVGRPNESVMIVDGDVYVREASAETETGDRFAGFKIQGKPRHVQDALWRVVVDGEFVPLSGGWQPWRVESGAGWDLGTPDKPARVYTFDAAQGGAGTILFDNDFVRDGITGHGRPFTDELAYAQAESGSHNVSDAKLSLLYDRTAGDGPLRLSLTKRGDTFTAELTRAHVKLFRQRGTTPAGPDDLGEEVAAAPAPSALAGGAAVQVDFMNVDHQVTLRVGGDDVLHTAYAPDVAALVRGARDAPKPQVRITAADQSCAVSHVSLWRDVYYTADRSEWATPHNPITLGPDEYFVLGDNTVISKDARFWTQPVRLPGEDLDVAAGRVPGRFLLGKAFFVYWPAGFRTGLTLQRFRAIPNFGDMRFIH